MGNGCENQGDQRIALDPMAKYQTMKKSKEKKVSCGKTVFSEALGDGRLSCRGRPLEGGWWQKQKEGRERQGTNDGSSK